MTEPSWLTEELTIAGKENRKKEGKKERRSKFPLPLPGLTDIEYIYTYSIKSLNHTHKHTHTKIQNHKVQISPMALDDVWSLVTSSLQPSTEDIRTHRMLPKFPT